MAASKNNEPIFLLMVLLAHVGHLETSVLNWVFHNHLRVPHSIFMTIATWQSKHTYQRFTYDTEAHRLKTLLIRVLCVYTVL